MDENYLFGDREAEFLRELLRQKVEFMVVGLSAATLQGAAVVTQDVDLWFRDLNDPGIRLALKKVGATYIPPILLNPPLFEGPDVRFFDIVLRMDGLGSFEEEKRNVIRIPLGRFKLPVLRLERIIASKKAADRPKDRRTVPILEDTLKTISS